MNTLSGTAADCLRFVTEFFEIISQSAPHIYHSALPLSPVSSVVRKLYEQHMYSVARVVTGIPASWDSCTATVGAASVPCHATWSPCGRFIAAGLEDDIEIRDSTTLGVLRSISFDEDFTPNFLAFSPDGHLLVCFYAQRRSDLFLLSIPPTYTHLHQVDRLCEKEVSLLSSVLSHPYPSFRTAQHIHQRPNWSPGTHRQAFSSRSSTVWTLVARRAIGGYSNPLAWPTVFARTTHSTLGR